MKRFLPLCMFGLVCLMALAMFAPTAANELTPLTVDQPATLAIQTTPATNTVDDFDTASPALLTPAQMKVANVSPAPTIANETQPAALDKDKAVTTSSRSMPLKISVAAALANFPNDFNGPTALVTTPNPAETILTATSALATPTGGQPQCRAVNFVASLVEFNSFGDYKLAA